MGNFDISRSFFVFACVKTSLGKTTVEVNVGKKRVAYEGSGGQDKRPLRMKKPVVRTPAQAMFDRYKKLQEMKQ